MPTQSETVHVALLENDEKFYIELLGMLSKSHQKFSIQWAKTGTELECVLKRGKIDVLVADMSMQEGLEPCHNPILRAIKMNLVPVIFLADQGDEARAVRAIKLGASDYLIKRRFDSSRFTYAIEEAMREHQERLEHAEKTHALIRLATIDELTGLYNRRYFMQRLRDDLDRFLRYDIPLSLAIIDVDKFKNINDTYGHAVGDQVLKELGQILGHTVRTTDCAARFGGEEFAITCANTGLLGTQQLAERLRDRVRVHPFKAEGDPFRVTLSIGVIQVTREINTHELLLKFADKALYRAKHLGRDRVVLYQSELCQE